MSTQHRKTFLARLHEVIGVIGNFTISTPQPVRHNEHRSTRKRRPLRMEALENRELFAVNVSLSGFQLNIEGDAQSNGISIQSHGSNT